MQFINYELVFVLSAWHIIKKLHKELCFLKASGLSSNKKESLIVILKLVIFRLNR